MSASPPINPEAPATPPPEGTGAEGSQRSSSPAGWFSGWTLFVLFLLYPLSIMPAYVVLAGAEEAWNRRLHDLRNVLLAGYLGAPECAGVSIPQ
jgi:hypothetical protein